VDKSLFERSFLIERERERREKRGKKQREKKTHHF